MQENTDWLINKLAGVTTQHKTVTTLKEVKGRARFTSLKTYREKLFAVKKLGIICTGPSILSSWIARLPFLNETIKETHTTITGRSKTISIVHHKSAIQSMKQIGTTFNIKPAEFTQLSDILGLQGSSFRHCLCTPFPNQFPQIKEDTTGDVILMGDYKTPYYDHTSAYPAVSPTQAYFDTIALNNLNLLNQNEKWFIESMQSILEG